MRKLRDVLRLKYDAGLPQRAIAQACGLGLGTVTTYLQRATAAGLTCPSLTIWMMEPSKHGCLHGPHSARARAVCDAPRAHAPRASRARGVDTLATDRLGGTDGPRHGPARRRHPRTASAPRAGLPRVSRTDAARTRARRGPARTACERAERLRSYRLRTVEHILKHQQDRLPLDEPPARPTLTHENLRGATYYEEVYADPSDD
jgi:hypothetical protein